MRISDKQIEWIVSLSVMFITTFFVCNTILTLWYSSFKWIVNAIRISFFLIMLLYQLQNYKTAIFHRGFFLFFSLYSIYILLYISLFRYYPLDEMYSVPSSVTDFLIKTLQIVGFILCSPTIINHFNITKYLLSSIIFCILPSLWYISYVGIDTIQTYGSEGYIDIGRLVFAYTNMTILVLGIIYISRLFNNKWISMSIAIIIILSTSYILLISTKRGPILWTLVTLFLYYYFKNKSIAKFLLISLVIGCVIYMNFDFFLTSLAELAPKSAERIMATIFEGDTAHRFDIEEENESGYIIGINQFLTSPMWGSYFRLITNSPIFRGHYPHNIFIEVLITMGILGFLPFLILLRKSFLCMKAMLNNKYTSNYEAFAIFFLTILFHRMTTGSIVLDIQFWTFFYITLIYPVNPYLNGKLTKTD